MQRRGAVQGGPSTTCNRAARRYDLQSRSAQAPPGGAITSYTKDQINCAAVPLRGRSTLDSVDSGHCTTSRVPHALSRSYRGTFRVPSPERRAAVRRPRRRPPRWRAPAASAAASSPAACAQTVGPLASTTRRPRLSGGSSAASSTGGLAGRARRQTCATAPTPHVIVLLQQPRSTRQREAAGGTRACPHSMALTVWHTCART